MMSENRTERRRSRTPAYVSMLFALPLCGALWYPNAAWAVNAQQVKRLLRVRPGATCLTSERLARQVEQRMPDEDIPADISIIVEGSATDPRSAVLNVVRGGQTLAHRDFEPGPARCDYLEAAVGLAIALALKALPPDDSEPNARGWSLSAACLGTYQLLPGFAAGLDLAAHWAPVTNVVFRFGALGNMEFDAELESDVGHFDATLIAARVDACLHFVPTDGLHVQACGGMLSGGLYVRGTDFPNPRSSVFPWTALANAVGLQVDLSTHWSLALDFSIVFLLHEVRIRVEDFSGREVDGQSFSRASFALGFGPMYNF